MGNEKNVKEKRHFFKLLKKKKKNTYEQSVHVAEMRIFTRMCGLTRNDRIRREYIIKKKSMDDCNLKKKRILFVRDHSQKARYYCAMRWNQRVTSGRCYDRRRLFKTPGQPASKDMILCGVTQLGLE